MNKEKINFDDCQSLVTKAITSGIIPTGGHILVLPDPTERTTAAGLIIPDTIADKNQVEATSGIVIAIGASAWKDLDDGAPWAKVGDRVCYGRFAGSVLRGHNELSYVLLNDNDLLAKLEF